MLLMLMKVLKPLNKEMFELIRTLPLLSGISLIPYAAISVESFTKPSLGLGKGSLEALHFQETA